jgi:hypothetical protein
MRWTLTVHLDSPTGRGSARVAIDAADGNADAAVLQAVTLARASIGSAWVTRPAAAPARMQLADPGLVKADLVDAATKLAQVAHPAGSTVDARATVLREHVTIVSHQGLHTDWLATRVRIDANVLAADAMLVVSREARRRDDLGMPVAVTAAVQDLQLLASAKTIAPGPCSFVLRSDAMLHDGLGLWSAFVAQADAVVERQGLTRYREHAPIAPGANAGAERLTIVRRRPVQPLFLDGPPDLDDAWAVRAGMAR